MSLTMYQASIPVFQRFLATLRKVLEKGEAHAAARKIDPAVLVSSRLFPDMFPLSRQVQIAADMAKGCAARLAGAEPPKWDDTETTFTDLIARIDRTLAYIGSCTPAQIDGSEERAIVLNTPRGTMNFTGRQYLLNFVMPNFYFHATTVYALLRHNGVELGKGDFLGNPTA